MAINTSTSTDTPSKDSVQQYESIQPVMTADLPMVLAEGVSYGHNGIRGLFSSHIVFGAAFLASLGGFSFGYDQGVISIINVMPSFHEAFPPTKTGFGKGFMTGMLEFGAFLGCFFFPYLADKVSRKWALTAVVVIFDIGAIIQTAASNYGMLVAGRTIGGIGVGTLAMVRTAPKLVWYSKTYHRNRVHHFTYRKSRLLIYVERSLSLNRSRLCPV